MMKWLVIGVGDITTKRVLPAIEEEEQSMRVGTGTRARVPGGLTAVGPGADAVGVAARGEGENPAAGASRRRRCSRPRTRRWASR